ncbi:hypothetical protein E5288_WYG014925 [Bos mutus]|uniref:Uncharacterized protein n=1 Tax=Bos mutus TaxID=72004 RepID=A0A6B0RRV8_9CETA|nr:hypothetical protein [Bos mutus]
MPEAKQGNPREEHKLEMEIILRILHCAGLLSFSQASSTCNHSDHAEATLLTVDTTTIVPDIEDKMTQDQKVIMVKRINIRDQPAEAAEPTLSANAVKTQSV